MNPLGRPYNLLFLLFCGKSVQKTLKCCISRAGVSSLDDVEYGLHTLGLTNGQEERRQPVAGKGAEIFPREGVGQL